MNIHSLFVAAAALATALALTACAEGGSGSGSLLSGLGISRAASGAANGFSYTPASAPQAGGASGAGSARSLIGSEVDGLLAKHPITDTNRPETWPRVAITITSASPALLKTVGFGDSASAGAGDCATYDVRVWFNAKDSKSYEGLRLCYGELYKRMQGVPMFQVPTWGRRNAWVGEPNTGSVRGKGPVPPAAHFPTDPKVQQLWLDPYKNTIYFVGGALRIIGLDWNETTDKRVWFVSVPAGS